MTKTEVIEMSKKQWEEIEKIAIEEKESRYSTFLDVLHLGLKQWKLEKDLEKI